MTLKFGSLFAGIGGFDLGFERAGMECAWQVEIDEFCRRVLAKHWPHVRRHDDVKSFPPSQIRVQGRGQGGAHPGISGIQGTDDGAVWSVDVVCGGDPCQENSRARITSGTTAPSLGAEFIRIVSLLRPTYVVRENPQHVRKDAPWPWWKFCDELRTLGYVVQPVPIRACCFGYPHRRARMLVLAQRADAYRQPLWVPGRRETAGTTAAVQRKAQERQRLWANAWTMVCSKRCGDDPRNGRVAHGISSGLDRTKRLRGCGNAVVPDIAEWVGRLICEAYRQLTERDERLNYLPNAS